MHAIVFYAFSRRGNPHKLASMGAFEDPLAATARRNSKKSSPVLVGNPSVEWPMMSV